MIFLVLIILLLVMVVVYLLEKIEAVLEEIMKDDE